LPTFMARFPAFAKRFSSLIKGLFRWELYRHTFI
jgi:hypothetical protein